MPLPSVLAFRKIFNTSGFGAVSPIPWKPFWKWFRGTEGRSLTLRIINSISPARVLSSVCGIAEGSVEGIQVRPGFAFEPLFVSCVTTGNMLNLFTPQNSNVQLRLC